MGLDMLASEKEHIRNGFEFSASLMFEVSMKSN